MPRATICGSASTSSMRCTLRARHVDRVQRGAARLRPTAVRIVQSRTFAQDLDAVRVAARRRCGSACRPRSAVAADQLREALPGVVDLRGDHEIAVLRAEHAVDACDCGRSWPVCTGTSLPPRQRVALHRVVVHRHHAVVQRHVDVLAAAATSRGRAAPRRSAATPCMPVYMSASGMRNSGGGSPGHADHRMRRSWPRRSGRSPARCESGPVWP